MHIEEQQGTIAMQKMREEAQARIIQNQATLVRSALFQTFRLKLGRWLGLDQAKQWQDKAEEERIVVLRYHLRLKSWKHKVFIHHQWRRGNRPKLSESSSITSEEERNEDEVLGRLGMDFL